LRKAAIIGGRLPNNNATISEICNYDSAASSSASSILAVGRRLLRHVQRGSQQEEFVRQFHLHREHSQGYVAMSALRRALHDLHGILHVAPLAGFFHLPLVLARQGILGGMSDGYGAVPIEHLSGDRMDLDLGNHLLSPDFLRAEANWFRWKPNRPGVFENGGTTNLVPGKTSRQATKVRP
jgi:hypothetical protein